jgi:sRNA-binding protein
LQNPLATIASSVDLALNRRQQKVARKSKIETEKQAEASAEADAKTADAAPKPKRKKAAPKKKPVATKPAAPKKVSSSSSRHEPSDEEIRIRAYFIAERRIQLSLQGDSAHDWIEARRQLIEEARTASS